MLTPTVVDATWMAHSAINAWIVHFIYKTFCVSRALSNSPTASSAQLRNAESVWLPRMLFKMDSAPCVPINLPYALLAITMIAYNASLIPYTLYT